MKRIFRSAVLWIIFCLICPLPVAAADISRDFNAGMYHYKKGEFAPAAQIFVMILSRPGPVSRADEVTHLLGECYYNLGKYPDALGVYKKLVSEFPRSKFVPRALLSAGYASMKLGLVKDAAAFFTRAVDDPDGKDIEIEARLALADSLSKIGDTRRAESTLRSVLSTPKSSPVQKQEAWAALGILLIHSGNLSDGRSALLRAVEAQGPRRDDALMALGDLSYEGGKYQESLQWYEKIFAKGRAVPRDVRAKALYGGAWAYLGMSQTEKAQSLFNEVHDDKAAQVELRADAALRLAYISRDKGARATADDFAKSAEQLASESRREKQMDDVSLFRAETAGDQKNFDQALIYLARIGKKDYRVFRLTGRIFFQTGRMADAVDYFERAALAAPTRAALNSGLFDMASVLYAAGQFDTAVAALERIKDPGDDIASRLKPFLGEALLGAGRSKDAAKLFNALASESADSASARRYHYFTALAYYQDKNYSKANKFLESYFESVSAVSGAADSTTAAALVLRADILAAQGKIAEARDAYMRALASAKPGVSDDLFLAYSHLVDFDIKHSKSDLAAHIDAFAAAIGDVRTYAFIFDRLYGSENFRHLLRYTDDMLGKFPSNDDIYGKTLYFKAMAHYKSANFSAAGAALNKLSHWLIDHPSPDMADEAAFWRARVFQSTGNLADAGTAFRTYLDLYPVGKYSAESRLHLGVMAIDAGLPEDAEREFQKLLAGKSPKEILSNANLSNAQYNMASVRILQNRYEDAESILEPLGAVKTFKSDPAYLYKLGYIKFSLGKWSAAEQLYREVLPKRDAPSSVMDNSVYGLFSLLYRRERYAELESEFKRLSDRIRDPEISSGANFLMGMTLFNAERFDDAIAYFTTIGPITDTELLIEASLRLADCDYNLKRFKQALARYSGIADAHASTGWGREASYAAGLCKIKLGMAESALSGFERFLQQNPEDPLARDVAMEAARLYLNRSDLDAAERKLDFLDRRRVDSVTAEEMLRLRIRVWQKRSNPDRVLQLAKSHRAAYGPDPQIAIAAADAAVQLSRPKDAIGALEGFGAKDIDSVVRANFDFYRAEALSQLGDPGAVELYKRLIDFPNPEIGLASKFRYASVLSKQKDHARARDLFSAVLASPLAKPAPFFQDAILGAMTAAKAAGEPAEITRVYDKFKKDIAGAANKISAAEHNLWARLALKDDANSQNAIFDLLTLDIPQMRRAEVLLTSAQLHESLNNPDRADAIYSGLMTNPEVDRELRLKAESRKVRLAISRGPRGLPVLEDYLRKGAQGDHAVRAAEALLDAAVKDKRHIDVIRLADLMRDKLSASTSASLYASAIARLALNDTAGASADFHDIADAVSPDTFYIAWASYRIAQDEFAAQNWPAARLYLQKAWAGRVNLSAAAERAGHLQLTQSLFEAGDDVGLKTLASDPLPAGVSANAPSLLRGILAFQHEDYASAVRDLKHFAAASDRVRMLYAESLALYGDTIAAFDQYDKIADGAGALAAVAQFRAADLLESSGRMPEALIAYYKVMAAHESDSPTEIAADALSRISRLYAKSGDVKKSRAAVAELLVRYPNARAAREFSVVEAGP